MKLIHRTPLTEHFTILPNALLRDTSISFRARGILVMMLSLPEDWQSYQTWIEEQGTEGREAIRSALKELETSGYLQRERVREKGKLMSFIWQWFDQPHDGNPASGNLTATKYPSVQKSKLSKAVSILDAEIYNAPREAIEPTWKPSPLTKEEQLSSLPNSEDYPGSQDFHDFLTQEKLDRIWTHREDLYIELCTRKWRHWRPDLHMWVPIHNWRRYVKGLELTMAKACGWDH